MKIKKKYFSFVILIILMILFSACQRDPRYTTKSGVPKYDDIAIAENNKPSLAEKWKFHSAVREWIKEDYPGVVLGVKPFGGKEYYGLDVIISNDNKTLSDEEKQELANKLAYDVREIAFETYFEPFRDGDRPYVTMEYEDGSRFGFVGEW